MIIHSLSDSQTRTIAEKLGKKLAAQKGAPSHFLCLFGDLGAGKTTFVRGLAAGLGISKRVQSPTFTYQRIYRGPDKVLYHFDYYRASADDTLLLEEIREAEKQPGSVIAVEWADRLRKHLPKKRTEIHFSYRAENLRRITFKNYD